MTYDNARPDDPLYPTAEPPSTANAPDGSIVTVRVGDYVVNRGGDIVIATTSNAGPYANEFVRDLNEGYFRAKYIGNHGDYLEFASQARLATIAEIEQAAQYQPKAAYALTTNGQAALL
jgi:hypothetical protein